LRRVRETHTHTHTQTERQTDVQKTVCSVLHSSHLNVSKARKITAYFVDCVIRERERIPQQNIQQYRNKTYS